MGSSLPIIREIRQADNPHIAKAIRAVFTELFDPRGVSKCGTAFEDPHLDHLFEEYQEDREVYFVIDKEGEILGGGGIKQLNNFEGNVCELQKMYFLPEARGLGLGAKMIQMCLDKARDFGFEHCYLETMTFMEDAQKLYLKNGFQYIDHPMGGTGHFSCPVWMLKKL